MYLLCICAIVVSIGCTRQQQVLKDRATASGTVTFNGQPLPAGTIGFESTANKVTTSVSIREGGKYTTDRAPVGSALVTVDTSSIKYGNPAIYVAIPEKYNNAKTSGLTADIKPGENENIDFTLHK